jgi:excisionase family DNA binding protein
MATTASSRPTRWVGLAAAGRLAGVDRTTVHRAASRGELPFAETSIGRLFRCDDVHAWVERRNQKTGAQQ